MPSAADFNELHTDPLTADVTTDESTTSGSYGDLTTAGPAVTKTLVAGQKVVVYVSARANAAVDGMRCFMSFAVSGASTLAAADVNAADSFMKKTGTNTADLVERWTVYTATNAGSHTFTAKYKGDGTNSMHWANRRIMIKPF